MESEETEESEVGFMETKVPLLMSGNKGNAQINVANCSNKCSKLVKTQFF